jgi:REP element-mobilizing transposase RayT
MPGPESLPKRRSIRLPCFDYSQTGRYFITICAFRRRTLFGLIENSRVCLNRIGEIAAACWLEIPRHFPLVTPGVFVVMPNHLHGILEIEERARRAVPLREIHRPESLRDPVSGSIPTIIRSYKSAVTKQVRELLHRQEYRVWQSNYYESVLRSEKECGNAVRYILENPKMWDTDSENPLAQPL